MLDIFNSYHQRIQFTHEVEINNTISFLEVLMERKNNKINELVQETTFSGRFLNFYSNHIKSHKIGIIYNLVDRAIHLADSIY